MQQEDLIDLTESAIVHQRLNPVVIALDCCCSHINNPQSVCVWITHVYKNSQANYEKKKEKKNFYWLQFLWYFPKNTSLTTTVNSPVHNTATAWGMHAQWCCVVFFMNSKVRQRISVQWMVNKAHWGVVVTMQSAIITIYLQMDSLQYNFAVCYCPLKYVFNFYIYTFSYF